MLSVKRFVNAYSLLIGGGIVLLAAALALSFLSRADKVNAEKSIARPIQIKNLKVGSPVDSIRVVERKRPDSAFDWLISYKNTKFAGETGAIEYRIEEGKIDRIEFTKEGDNGAYHRILDQLEAQYGPFQDSSGTSLSWKNDSLELELNQFEKSTTVTLIGYY